MIGTLFPAPTASCHKVYSNRKIYFTGKSSCNSTIYAAATQAIPPVVETSRKKVNLYEVLKVKREASQSEIKRAYRTLAKIYHPDVSAAAAKHPEESVDGRDFIEIHNAYATLSDPSARAMYDLTMSIGSRHQQRPVTRDYSGDGGYRKWSGYYSTSRWETDQCW